MKLYGGYINPGTIRALYRRLAVRAIETLICVAAVSAIMALGGLLCALAGVG